MSASEIFHTAGRRKLNQILNKALSAPTTWYLGLRTLDGAGSHTADAAAADTLTSNLNEVSGSGYARIPITNNSTNAAETASGADSLLSYAQQMFTFSGTVTGITHAFICDSSDNSGVLWFSAPLSVTYNVSSGGQIVETFQFKLTQG